MDDYIYEINCSPTWKDAINLLLLIALPLGVTFIAACIGYYSALYGIF